MLPWIAKGISAALSGWLSNSLIKQGNNAIFIGPPITILLDPLMNISRPLITDFSP